MGTDPAGSGMNQKATPPLRSARRGPFPGPVLEVAVFLTRLIHTMRDGVTAWVLGAGADIAVNGNYIRKCHQAAFALVSRVTGLSMRLRFADRCGPTASQAYNSLSLDRNAANPRWGTFAPRRPWRDSSVHQFAESSGSGKLADPNTEAGSPLGSGPIYATETCQWQ